MIGPPPLLTHSNHPHPHRHRTIVCACLLRSHLHIQGFYLHHLPSFDWCQIDRSLGCRGGAADGLSRPSTCA
jgi:hypothetical protein